MKQNTLAVAEQFFSIQGEGCTVGIPSYFLRLAGCNLMCGGKGTDKDGKLHDGATWRCDTIEVWMKGQIKTFADIVGSFGGQKFIDNINNGAHLVITGGEPLIQQNEIEGFINYLKEYRANSHFIEIETNGTIEPSYFLQVYVSQWNVSPKLKNSGMSLLKRVNPEALRRLNLLNSIFKFVIKEEKDFEEAWFMYNQYINQEKIYLMPACDNAYDLPLISQRVIELCLKNNLNFSPRLHIHVWDKKTGV